MSTAANPATTAGAQAKSLPEKMPMQYRRLDVRGAKVDKEARTIELSFSSEEPVERSTWFGSYCEVLDHGKSAVRMARMDDGAAPLLFNHDPDKIIGVVEKAAVKSGRGEATVRFATGKAAEKVFALVNEGILRNVSVGYIVHRWQITEGEKNEPDEYRAIDWEPVEVSLVSVPADPSVGVGRKLREFPTLWERSISTPALPAAVPAAIEVTEEKRQMATTAVVPVDAGKEAIVRAAALIALGEEYKEFVTNADIRAAVEGGTTVGAFKEAIADKIIKARDANKILPLGGQVVNSLGRDSRRYSVKMATRYMFNRMSNGSLFAGQDFTLEKEVSDEIAKRSGQETPGVFIATILPAQRDIQAGTNAAAAVMTTTQPEVIEILRNRAKLIQIGARRLSGLEGILKMPRQITAVTSSWLAETIGTAASDLSLDSISLSPKRLSTQSIYTIELLAQSSPDIEALLRADQESVIALSIDSAGLSGSGVAPIPKGALNYAGLASVTPTGAALANGKFLSYVDVVAFETDVAVANADVATMGWLMTPEVRGLMKTTQKFPGVMSNPIWPDSGPIDPANLQEGPLGYRAGVTNQLPKTGHSVTIDLHGHAVLFGDFSTVLIGDWGAMEVIMDPYTKAGNGEYVVTQRGLFDVQLRHVEKLAASTTVAVA